MGIPLCVALFGAESLAPAAFATLLTASVLFGCAIALIELDRQQAPGLGATLLKVGQALMRNPLLAAPWPAWPGPPPASRCPKGWTAT